MELIADIVMWRLQLTKIYKQKSWSDQVEKYKSRNPPGDTGAVPVFLADQSLASLNYWLSRFVIECRRKDGSPYPPNTITFAVKMIPAYCIFIAVSVYV